MQIKESYVYHFYGNQRADILVMLMKKNSLTANYSGKRCNLFFLLSNKLLSKEKVTHSKNEKVLDQGRDTTEVLNTFFSNIVDNISIADYNNCDSLANKIGNSRSSHRMCSVKTGVLRNLAKFTGKNLCQSLFFDKVASFRPVTLLQKRF